MGRGGRWDSSGPDSVSHRASRSSSPGDRKLPRQAALGPCSVCDRPEEKLNQSISTIFSISALALLGVPFLSIQDQGPSEVCL